jgi:hypothetical protein
MPNDFDPERFTLRQAAQARDDFAKVMDELDFVKELIARLPTRRDQAFVPLRIMLGSAVSQRFVRDRLDRAILVALPLNSAPSHGPCTHRS